MNCWGCGACTEVGAVAEGAGGADWPESCAAAVIVSAPAISIVVNRKTHFKADKDIRVSPCIRTARNDDKAFLFQIQVLLRKTPCAGFIFVLPASFEGKASHFLSNCRVECNSIADARSATETQNWRLHQLCQDSETVFFRVEEQAPDDFHAQYQAPSGIRRLGVFRMASAAGCGDDSGHSGLGYWTSDRGKGFAARFGT